MYYQKKRRKAYLRNKYTIADYFAMKMLNKGLTVEKFNKIMGLEKNGVKLYSRNKVRYNRGKIKLDNKSNDGGKGE